MLVISSASFSPSLYSRIHESPEEAITWRDIRKKYINFCTLTASQDFFLKNVMRIVILYAPFPSLEVLRGWSIKTKIWIVKNHIKTKGKEILNEIWNRTSLSHMMCNTIHIQQLSPNITKNKRNITISVWCEIKLSLASQLSRTAPPPPTIHKRKRTSSTIKNKKEKK